MDIYAPKGTKVRFTTAPETDDQIRWGSHTDPRWILMPGDVYTVARTEVHSSHTKVFLKEVLGSFNSVWFEEA